jgi:hypothetical protein
MSTIIFSKTFIEKIISVMRRFWWAGVQQDDPLTLLLTGPVMISANLKIREDLAFGTFTLSIKVLLFTLLIILQILKIPSFQLF